MQEQQGNAEVSPIESTNDISHDAVDKFFESGGNDLPDAAEHETQSDDTPAPEVENAPPPQQDTEKERRMVEYGALQEERGLRKELQGRMQKMESAFQMMIQKQMEQSQPRHQIPSYEEDPIEHLRQKQEVLNNYVAQDYQTKQQQAQQQQQQAEVQKNYHDLKQKCTADATAYIGKNPEYTDAYKYLFENRLAEYKASGYSDQQAQQLLVEDEMAIAVQAYNQNANPAERIHQIAKMRGFKPQTAQSGDKMKTMQKGMEASRSLGSGGGKSPSTGLSLEQLSQMDPDELRETLADEKKWAKIMKMG